MANYKCEEILQATMTQTDFGKLVGLTQQRINQLIDEQVVVRDETSRSGRIMFYESMQNYLLSGKSSGDGASFWKERTLHEAAKRKLAELKLSKTRGEVYSATLVEAVLVELLTNFRAKLQGIGHKLAPQLQGKTSAQICDLIDAEIHENLTELSEGLEKAELGDEECD